MRNLFITLICLVSVIFFILSYQYFHFGSDFYFKSNFLVLTLLISLYALGFFLGRFFPFDQIEVDERSFSGDVKKDVVIEKIDYKNIEGVVSHPGKRDNLQLLEGIGPKVQDLLYGSGIFTFQELSGCSIEKLNSILESGGDRFALCNPSTWPYQAQLAAEKNWAKLKEYQDFLLRGIES